MDAGHPDRLADLIAALGEFSARLGLGDAEEAALRGEVDAMRVHLLWRPDRQELDTSLRRVRDILVAAGDNRLARGVLAEIDAILAEG